MNINPSVNNGPQFTNFQKACDCASYTANNSKSLEKAFKFTYRSIELGGIMRGSLSAAGKVVSTQFKDAIEIIETMAFFGVLKGLTCPDEKTGKYFLTDKKINRTVVEKRNDRIEIAARVTLAAFLALKVVNLSHKFGLINLGKIAKVAIGNMPIFKLTMESLILANSWCSLWGLKVKFNAEAKDLKKDQLKIEKWQARPEVIEKVRAGDQALIAQLGAKYAGKIDNLNQASRLYTEVLQKLDVNDPQYAQLSPAQRNEMRSEYAKKAVQVAAKIQAKKSVWQGRLDKIAKHDHKGLADELAGKKVDHKLRKWVDAQGKDQSSRTKTWLGLLGTIAKIAAISLALVCTFISAFTVPVVLSLVLLGMINDITGLAKMYMTDVKSLQTPTPALALPAKV